MALSLINQTFQIQKYSHLILDVKSIFRNSILYWMLMILPLGLQHRDHVKMPKDTVIYLTAIPEIILFPIILKVVLIFKWKMLTIWNTWTWSRAGSKLLQVISCHIRELVTHLQLLINSSPINLKTPTLPFLMKSQIQILFWFKSKVNLLNSALKSSPKQSLTSTTRWN